VPVDQPVIGVRLHAAKRAARWFVENFPGETLYAVKANDSPAILNTLFEAGLDKIEAVTGGAKDLTLVVRVACPSTYSEIALEGKFGAPWSEAPELIRRARQQSELLGISFHVGSQMMCP